MDDKWAKLRHWVAKAFEGWSAPLWLLEGGLGLVITAVVAGIFRMTAFQTFILGVGSLLLVACGIGYFLKVGLVREPLDGLIKKQRAKALTIRLRELKETAGDTLLFKISVGPVDRINIATELESLFRLAGWEGDLNSVAQELYKAPPWFGIEIEGHNDWLLKETAAALESAGCSDLHIKLLPPLDNRPEMRNKIQLAQRRVRIRIGRKKLESLVE